MCIYLCVCICMYVYVYLTTGIHYSHFSIIYIYHVIDNLVQQITLPSTVNTFEMIKFILGPGSRPMERKRREMWESQNQWPTDACVLSSGVSRLKLAPRCMSLKTVDSGSRLKAGSVESLELLHPSKVIDLWVLCCLFVWFICLCGEGLVTVNMHVPGGQLQVLFLGHYTPCFPEARPLAGPGLTSLTMLADQQTPRSLLSLPPTFWRVCHCMWLLGILLLV